MEGNYFYGTGRRKTSTARVRIYDTPGGVIVNGKSVEDFLNRVTNLFLCKLWIIFSYIFR